MAGTLLSELMVIFWGFLMVIIWGKMKFVWIENYWIFIWIHIIIHNYGLNIWILITYHYTVHIYIHIIMYVYMVMLVIGLLLPLLLLLFVCYRKSPARWRHRDPSRAGCGLGAPPMVISITSGSVPLRFRGWFSFVKNPSFGRFNMVRSPVVLLGISHRLVDRWLTGHIHVDSGLHDSTLVSLRNKVSLRSLCP